MGCSPWGHKELDTTEATECERDEWSYIICKTKAVRLTSWGGAGVGFRFK